MSADPATVATPVGGSRPVSATERVTEWLQNPPQLFIHIAGFSLVLNILGFFVPQAINYIALVPGLLFSKYTLWSLVTYPVIHAHPLFMMLDLLAFLSFAKFLESRWTATQSYKYLGVVTITSGFATMFASVFMYMGTRRFRYLFSPIQGFAAVLSGLSVVVKQLVPSRDLDFGQFVLPATYLPMSVVCSISTIALILGHYPTIVLAWSGFFYGWVYLRFFMSADDGGSGDPNDEFAFEHFFPDAIKPIIRSGGGIVWIVTKNFLAPKARTSASGPGGAVSRSSYHPDTGNVVYAPLSAAVANSPVAALPGVDQRDADRRRARALEALDRRLASMASVPEIPLDNDAEPAADPSMKTDASS